MLSSSISWASDGYFQSGFGQKVVAMGGASDGIVTGAMGGADNPASIAFAGESFSIGGTYFVPGRTASQTGNAYGLNGAVTSKDDNFVTPDFGFNTNINRRLSFGITVYGNGGMNTDYPVSLQDCPSSSGKSVPGNILCGQGHLGVNLDQLIIAPTLAYKVTPSFAVAISPQIIYQMFSAEGLQSFTADSIHPNSVTNRGGDNAPGIGVKIGFFWNISRTFALGGTFSPQAAMARFKKYAGLFAGDGAFNVPANFSVGFGYHPTPSLTFAMDFQRIFYAGIPSIADQSSNQELLGSPNGPGAGWQNINVYKFGFADKLTSRFTVRGGLTHAGDPITPANVTVNIMAPSVSQNQLSGGITYHLSGRDQITATYTHAFNATLTGPANALLPGAGFDHISLESNSIGVGYMHTF
jgi:long-chain fatty acid transport protein